MLRRLSARLVRRLDRIAAIVEGWRAAREREARTRQARRRFVELLRLGLRRAGVDPAAVPALRRFDRPEPPTDPPLSLPARPPAAVETFLSRVADIARRCRDNPPPLDRASPVELFAMYCVDAPQPDG